LRSPAGTVLTFFVSETRGALCHYHHIAICSSSLCHAMTATNKESMHQRSPEIIARTARWHNSSLHAKSASKLPGRRVQLFIGMHTGRTCVVFVDGAHKHKAVHYHCCAPSAKPHPNLQKFMTATGASPLNGALTSSPATTSLRLRRSMHVAQVCHIVHRGNGCVDCRLRPPLPSPSPPASPLLSLLPPTPLAPAVTRTLLLGLCSTKCTMHAGNGSERCHPWRVQRRVCEYGVQEALAPSAGTDCARETDLSTAC
jgi:hypothetical protein